MESVIISAVVAVLASVIVPMVLAYMGRKQKTAETLKTEAERDQTASETWAGLVEPMQKRIAELDSQYETARKSIQALEATVRTLQATIAAQASTIKRQDGQIRVLMAQVQATGQEPYTLPDTKS